MTQTPANPNKLDSVALALPANSASARGSIPVVTRLA
jgi:hypothetical protein